MTGPAHWRVLAALKESLMNGDFKPGDRIVVREMAEKFAISAMPVREALRQLVSDEALFDHPNKGVIVPFATVDAIVDLSRVRCSIEGAATEWAASTINGTELETLHRLDADMHDFAADGVANAYLALNRQFHFTIYQAAGSAVLQPIIERLWLRAGPWLNIMRGEATLGLGLDHHAAIMDALRKGDGPAARRALIRDISDATDILLRAATRSHPAPAKGAAAKAVRIKETLR